MASRAMGSRSTGGTRVELDVWHGERDSFSRSVDPCAKRRFAELQRGGTFVGHWAVTNATYAHTQEGTGEWVSTIVFERRI